MLYLVLLFKHNDKRGVKVMLKDILKKVPGFRTGHKWKMVVAVIIYL